MGGFSVGTHSTGRDVSSGVCFHGRPPEMLPKEGEGTDYARMAGEVKSEGRSRRHRITFNSLYLFSLGLLSMKQMERYCMIHAWRELFTRRLRGLRASAVFFPRLHSRKRSGGVASMTRDRGYPDWLVLSARLLRSGYHSAGCVWLVAMCSLLLYVVIFVTQANLGVCPHRST